jgi:hypothetical protein
MSNEVYLEVVEEPHCEDTASREELAQSILTTAIVGLALSASGIASIAGIFVSKSALNKAEEYAVRFGKRTGKALIGGHLARGGFFGGIGMTALFALLFFIYLVEFIVLFMMMDF